MFETGSFCLNPDQKPRCRLQGRQNSPPLQKNLYSESETLDTGVLDGVALISVAVVIATRGGRRRARGWVVLTSLLVPPRRGALCEELNWMVNSGVIYPVIH